MHVPLYLAAFELFAHNAFVTFQMWWLPIFECLFTCGLSRLYLFKCLTSLSLRIRWCINQLVDLFSDTKLVKRH